MPQWTVQLEGGPRRVNHAAVAIGDNIYSFGGYCTGEDYSTTRPMDVYVLNTVIYRWVSLPLDTSDSVPYQRYGHTAVAHGDCAYIWGGRNDKDGACKILYCFDTSLRRWSQLRANGSIPGARDGHSACVIGDRMYVFGGYEEDVDKFSNEVHSLDFPSLTWSLLKYTGRPAQWRDFHSATGIGPFMYIFGGRSDQGGPFHTNHEVYCNKVQIFNTTTHDWFEPVTSGQTPIGRRSHSAFVYGGNLYIFGGYNGLHEVHFGDMFKLDVERNEWSVVKPLGHGPCSRRRQCCCIIENRVFLFGGTSPCPDPPEGTEIDLIDQSDLHVLDFSPSLKTLCMLTVVQLKLDPSCLPRDVRLELQAMTTNNTISRPLNMSG